MAYTGFTKVEKAFKSRTCNTRVPTLVVDNIPKLGLLTALRFLEWVDRNPAGVISLPTGKTPEYFLKWTEHLLENWDQGTVRQILEQYAPELKRKPELSGLSFVQIDEFYPIPSDQHNSFNYFVREFYIKGFGLDPGNALLINSDEIPLPEGKNYAEVFPDLDLDLTLRHREAKSPREELQQRSILAIDRWCSQYESRIRELGGIGFFLGGIGPDGHIAFNTRGSDHYSTTRLTATNFETQAVAASDLGGIEVSRKRLVITIGLETIAYNPDVSAIIFAAGDAKAPMVRDALENEPSNLYPASSLQKLRNARFYLTRGAASLLKDSIRQYYTEGEWSHEKTERAVIDLCIRLDKYGHHLNPDDMKKDEFCRLIPGLDEHTVQSVIDSVLFKLEKGMKKEENQVYYHTGPHHDDIMLGFLPHIHRLLRYESNRAFFSVFTSGFTAVTNQFVMDILEDTRDFLDRGEIQMIRYPDFFKSGYKFKWDKDVYHFLNKVASGDRQQRRRGLAHRVVRSIVDIWEVKNAEQLRDRINDVLSVLRNSYDGEKNPPRIQKLKGMIREFEEELVWAHFGIPVRQIHHLRLGFYTGDIFTPTPDRERDVKPILEELKKIDPTVISLVLDPEGSGPDTHYKVLQTLAEAVKLYSKERDTSDLRIWGYRNVWHRFHPSEANVIVPVSLNAMATLKEAFESCYMSQVDASFPSYMHDGKFSELTTRFWVDQLKTIQLLLGKNFFYQHEGPRIRACHGLLFFKEMKVEEFLASARELEKFIEGTVV